MCWSISFPNLEKEIDAIYKKWNADWKAWRSPRVFDYVNPKSIQKVSTNFIGNEKESYTIIYNNDTFKMKKFSFDIFEIALSTSGIIIPLAF